MWDKQFCFLSENSPAPGKYSQGTTMEAEVWCGLAKATPASDADLTSFDFLLLETDFHGSTGTHIFANMKVGTCAFV